MTWVEHRIIVWTCDGCGRNEAEDPGDPPEGWTVREEFDYCNECQP